MAKKKANHKSYHHTPTPNIQHFELKKIEPLTENQRKTFQAFHEGYNMMLHGVAGTGKTYCAVGLALDEILAPNSYYDRLIIVRSVVPSRDIGFLPGSIKEKSKVYEEPYKEICDDLFGRGDGWEVLKTKGLIDFTTTSFLRGLTFNNSIVIVDECFPYNQNILTSSGKKKIGRLYDLWKNRKPLPLVKTYNEQTEEFEFKKITHAWCRGKKKIMKIICSNREIKCTENHKFLLENGEWKEASNLRVGNLIKTTGPNFHQLLRKWNEDQKQLILGSFLGDGSIQSVGLNRYRWAATHGNKQKNYCEWKTEILDGFTCEFVGGYSKSLLIQGRSKTFGCEAQFPTNKSTCPQWIIDNLDARGLAIWFMDDGSKFSNYNGASLSTCSFDMDTQMRLVQKLQNMGIDCSYRFNKMKNRKKEGYYTIYLSKKGYLKLCEIVAPYVHDDLQYKLAPQFRKISKYVWSKNWKNYGLTVVDKIEFGFDEVEVFDIEVEDNHNFILASQTKIKKDTGGIITHNCQNNTFPENNTIITRMGENSRIIFCGDFRQTDLKKYEEKSNLQHFMNILGRMKSFRDIEFKEEDIVRSGLVKEYIIASTRYIEEKNLIL